jgi:hypothetical protein
MEDKRGEADQGLINEAKSIRPVLAGTPYAAYLGHCLLALLV